MANLPTLPAGLNREDFTTIVHALRFAAARNPELTAVVCLDESMTYRELNSASSSFAHFLSHQDLNKGDRVALVAKTSLKLPALVYGIMGAGAHLTMINPHFTKREWRPLLRIAEPRLIICDDDLREDFEALSKEFGFEIYCADQIGLDLSAAKWQEDRVPAGNDPAILLYTGGTTGTSKAVAHTHHQILASLVSIEDRWQTSLDEEIFLNVPPLFHIVGLFHGLFQPVYGRATTILMPRFNPEETLELIEKYEVTICVAGVPTAYTALLAHPRCKKTDFSSLKFAGGGGAPG